MYIVTKMFMFCLRNIVLIFCAAMGAQHLWASTFLEVFYVIK